MPLNIMETRLHLYSLPEILGITNKYGASIYYEHETGTDQVDILLVNTVIPAFIRVWRL